MSNVVPGPGGQIPALSGDLDREASDPNRNFFGPRETAAEREARIRRGDDAPGMVVGDYSRDVPALTRRDIAEAQEALVAIDAALVPLPAAELQQQVETFLGLVNIGVANPQDAKALRLREKALWIACNEMPRCAWSQDATRAALARFKFFPSVAEVMVLLNEHVAPCREKGSRLRQMLARRPEPTVQERRKPTPEERATVAEKVAQLQREQAEREAAEERIREFGAYMPGNDTTLRGWDLVRALEADLPQMTGGLRAVTEERISCLRRAFQAADALMEDAKNG